MKSSINFLSLFLFAFFLFQSCGNADDDVNFPLNQGELGQGEEPDDCLEFGENELLLSIQDQFTTLPGKVSILFKVSDNQGNPVSGLTADQFTIYEQGRNDDCFNTISSSESQARISPNSQVFSNNTILVLDLSNSVLQGSLEELKTASTSFVNNVMPEVETESFKMAIYWFDGEDVLHLLNPLTSSTTELTAAIDGITTDISNDPSTDLYGAVIKSTDIAEDLIEQLKEKIRVDDEKKARVAKAKEKKSEKAAEPAPPVKGDTPEDRQAKVRDLLKAYAYKFGGEKAMAVLKKFDASKISEIAVADLDKFIAEITIEG